MPRSPILAAIAAVTLLAACAGPSTGVFATGPAPEPGSAEAARQAQFEKFRSGPGSPVWKAQRGGGG